MLRQVSPNIFRLPFTALISHIDTEDGNEMSRSSSVSTKDRASQNKRPKPAKQRRDDSESFDVRSQYAPYFPQQQAPTWVPTQQYAPMVPPQYSGGTVQPSYQNPLQPQFVPPPQYNSSMMPGGAMQYNPSPQVCNFLVGTASSVFIDRCSNIPRKVNLAFNLIVPLLAATARQYSHHHPLLSSGHSHSNPYIKVHINQPKDLWSEDPRIQSRTRLVNCQALPIQQTRRASIRSQEASTATLSIQRHNHSSLAIQAFPSRSQCHITDLLTMVPPISLIMPSLPHNNSLEMVWVTTWHVKALITRCLRTMPLLIWLNVL